MPGFRALCRQVNFLSDWAVTDKYRPIPTSFNCFQDCIMQSKIFQNTKEVLHYGQAVKAILIFHKIYQEAINADYQAWEQKRPNRRREKRKNIVVKHFFDFQDGPCGLEGPRLLTPLLLSPQSRSAPIRYYTASFPSPARYMQLDLRLTAHSWIAKFWLACCSHISNGGMSVLS